LGAKNNEFFFFSPNFWLKSITNIFLENKVMDWDHCQSVWDFFGSFESHCTCLHFDDDDDHDDDKMDGK